MLKDHDLLKLIGRNNEMFIEDVAYHNDEILSLLKNSKVLVVGASGSIGSAVVNQLFRRSPATIHAVDISENNLVELVRNTRSSMGYFTKDFRTFCLDILANDFEDFYSHYGPYDYVLNFSAMKHVRSERDIYTLRRMFAINVLGAIKLVKVSRKYQAKKFFCVSTDKAANPVNLMGASKRIMELFLHREANGVNISMARFANVIFSDGSLPYGFLQRFTKRQPLSAPRDIRRYFLTHQEAGKLCLLSALYGVDNEIFFPKLNAETHLQSFGDIATRLIELQGFEPVLFDNEEAARSATDKLIAQKKWPCYLFDSDTPGEKSFEEFFTESESPVWDRYKDIAVVRGSLNYDHNALNEFEKLISENTSYAKDDLLAMVSRILPNFQHIEGYKNLDQKM